jgi:hypothetical protein
MIITIFGGCASVNVFIPPWRKPGEKLLDPPEKIYREYNCQNEEMPFIIVEHNELRPRRLMLQKGKKLNHRLIYGLCSDNYNDKIVGQLYTRITHRGKNVVTDVDETYTLKPGRWLVDTFITLLENLDAGVYTLEIEFYNPKVDFKVENTFIVEPNDVVEGVK